MDTVEGMVAMGEDMVDTEEDMAAIMERDLLNLVIDLVDMVVIAEVTDLTGVTVEDMGVMEAMVDTIMGRGMQDMVDMDEAMGVVMVVAMELLILLSVMEEAMEVMEEVTEDMEDMVAMEVDIGARTNIEHNTEGIGSD